MSTLVTFCRRTSSLCHVGSGVFEFWEQDQEMNGRQLKHALSHYFLDTRLGIVKSYVDHMVTHSHVSVGVTCHVDCHSLCTTCTLLL